MQVNSWPRQESPLFKDLFLCLREPLLSYNFYANEPRTKLHLSFKTTFAGVFFMVI